MRHNEIVYGVVSICQNNEIMCKYFVSLTKRLLCSDVTVYWYFLYNNGFQLP